VSHILDEPIKFSLENPKASEYQHEAGEVEITFPQNKRLFSGKNLLIAVMYSAEMGEEYENI
jgi:hypothetical protein